MISDRSRPELNENAHTSGDAWNKNMVLGSNDTPNKFVEYTDYFCPYCEKVQKATEGNFSNDYIDNGKVRFENRIITVLKSLSPNTEQGAEAAYCSAEQGKYWEYSRNIVPRIKADYWDKGIGIKEVANPVPIEKLPIEYFLVSARSVGLDEERFKTCVLDETYKKEIDEATAKAEQLGVSGLPYMVVNDYVSGGGFVGGYDALKLVLKAGGVQ